MIAPGASPEIVATVWEVVDDPRGRRVHLWRPRLEAALRGRSMEAVFPAGGRGRWLRARRVP